jgi:hypothetical protein
VPQPEEDVQPEPVVPAPRQVPAFAESVKSWRFDSSTASNSAAGTCLSSAISWSGQLGSVAPWKYQSEPLSARISPKRCIARSTTCVSALNPEMS